MKLPQVSGPLSVCRISLITPAELAAKLKVTQDTLANWRMKGQGPVYLRIGGQIRYQPHDVAGWLASRKGALS